MKISFKKIPRKWREKFDFSLINVNKLCILTRFFRFFCNGFKITNFFPGIGSYHLGTIPSLLLCYWTTLCYFVFTTPHGRVKRRRKTSLFLPLASSSSTTAMTQWRRKMKSGRESFDLFTCVWTTCSHFQKFARNFFNFTLFEIFIFCPKIQLWFPVKIVDFWVEKLVKMLWFWTF